MYHLRSLLLPGQNVYIICLLETSYQPNLRGPVYVPRKFINVIFPKPLLSLYSATFQKKNEMDFADDPLQLAIASRSFRKLMTWTTFGGSCTRCSPYEILRLLRILYYSATQRSEGSIWMLRSSWNQSKRADISTGIEASDGYLTRD